MLFNAKRGVQIPVSSGHRRHIDNTMLVAFVAKFIRRDKKQGRNGEGTEPVRRGTGHA